MTYGCHNKPRPTPETTHPGQDGWVNSWVRNIVQIKHAMSCECMYDRSATDAKCAGCAHISKEQEWA